ncbi:MAG: NYN domain-containing protein [Candidatus Heimdallarchaeota archaeon]|nr:NYN domain-containing protein [Candidatus Heimdallarchaeota archaeon]
MKLHNLFLSGFNIEEDIAIFWDVENLPPGSSFSIENVVEDIRQKGRIIISWAFADWVVHVKTRDVYSNKSNRRDVLFVRENFDIMQTPKISDIKNFADHLMIDRIAETLENYPHVGIYVIVAKDGDFRQITRSIRKKGKKVWLYTEPRTANNTLLEAADEVVDIMNLESFDEIDDESIEITADLVKSKVIEAIEDELSSQKLDKQQFVNVGHVLTRLKAIFPEFENNLNEIQTLMKLKKNGWWKQLLVSMEQEKLVVIQLQGNKLMVKLTNVETDTQREIREYASIITSILAREKEPILLSVLGQGLYDNKTSLHYKKLGFNSLRAFLRKMEQENNIILSRNKNGEFLVSKNQ